MAHINDHGLSPEASDVFHVEVVPGTDIMRDFATTHFAHVAGSADGSVLIPQPSEDPHDPLNWSKIWKAIIIAGQFLYVFVTVMSALSIAPMFPLLAKEFSLDNQQVSLITGVCVITLGYANFFIIPCSNIFGRRFTCIFLAVFVIVTNIWEAEAKTYGSLLAARALNGVATATNESIMMQVVADMFFLHERGFWTGIYFTAYFLGLFIGPVISGNIAEKHGWRSFFWLTTGLSVLCLLVLLFGFPETKYRRSSTAAARVIAEKESPDPQVTLDEKGIEPNNGAIHSETASTAALVGKGRPQRSQFALSQRPDNRWKQFLVRDITLPLRAFLYPIIFWAGLTVAGSANTLLLWNLTESAVLSAPPFNWNPALVGYSNFAFVVGGLIGLATAGPCSDWIAKVSTKRNDGVREAEMRLLALIPFAILTAIGVIVGGLGYVNTQWGWAPIVVVGYGFTGLCTTSLPTIAIAYAIDCYKPISGEIMVVATVLKNTQGFGMSYWVSPLAEKHTWIAPVMVQFALVMLPCVLAIPVYIWGKKLRTMTKNSSMHRMEDI